MLRLQEKNFIQIAIQRKKHIQREKMQLIEMHWFITVQMQPA